MTFNARHIFLSATMAAVAMWGCQSTPQNAEPSTRFAAQGSLVLDIPEGEDEPVFTLVRELLRQNGFSDAGDAYSANHRLVSTAFSKELGGDRGFVVSYFFSFRGHCTVDFFLYDAADALYEPAYVELESLFTATKVALEDQFPGTITAVEKINTGPW